MLRNLTIARVFYLTIQSRHQLSCHQNTHADTQQYLESIASNGITFAQVEVIQRCEAEVPTEFLDSHGIAFGQLQVIQCCETDSAQNS